MRSVAIILAGGSGKRMGTDIPKQYLEVKGKPILYYTIKAFEDSPVDGIILVAGEAYIDMVRKDIVEKYGFKKIEAIVAGGKERYDSVYNGLKAIKKADYVLIHDGARPLVSEKVIVDSIAVSSIYNAAISGVPAKDTIKVVNSDGVAINTPNRRDLWIIQTPQTFSYDLIMKAHEKQHEINDPTVTDDACVVERYTDTPVHVFEGSYENIKITTPEDLELMKMWLH